MTTIEITLQHKRDNYWPVVLIWQADGLPIRREEKLRLDRVELLSQATPLLYGTYLGETLFQGTIRDSFNQALSRSDSNNPLQIWLTVDDPELKLLHWQRLCFPLDERWDYLCLYQNILFSRYITSRSSTPFPPIGRRDMRALVVVANPIGLNRYGLNTFDSEAITAEIKATLGDIPYDILEPPSLNALLKQLTQQSYTLLHWVSHGKYNHKKQDTDLYLSNEANQVAHISATDLIKQLRRVPKLPYFIFLSACESATVQSSNSEEVLDGFAQRLVHELGIPAVLGMADLISIETSRQLATHFYRRLRAQTHQCIYIDRILAEAMAGLSHQADITIPTLYHRLGSRPLFDDGLDKPLNPQDIAQGLQRLPALIMERAPSCEAKFTHAKATLERYGATNKAVLSAEAQKEYQTALQTLNDLCLELFDITFHALALGEQPPQYNAKPPFLGLYSFDQHDREFFFGREALSQTLFQRLATFPFLAILGQSGSGKSSLVLAGIFPLFSQAKDIYLTPTNTPLSAWTQALTQFSALSADTLGVIILDQFEELFTLCDQEADRVAFLQQLVSQITDCPPNLKLILTMRADFLGECANYPDFKTLLLAHLELISPLRADELQIVMEKQAAQVGLKFEANLSQTILSEVQQEPGAMPLLQHLLRELWGRRHGRWLLGTEYQHIGGVKQAIAHTADVIYTQADDTKKRVMYNIFTRLTRLDDQIYRLENSRDTRRRVDLNELLPAQGDQVTVKSLIQELATARLVVTSSDENAGQYVEVAHEALIRHWSTLQTWLKEDRQALQTLEIVRQAANEWLQNQRVESYLVHTGDRLSEAERLIIHPNLSLNDLELEYLDRCITRARQPQYVSRKVKRFAPQRQIIRDDLHVLCEYVLLQCSEFDTHDLLQHLFSLPRLKFFRDGLPYADNKTDRVNATIDYLLPITTIEGNSAFIWLLDELLQQRTEEDLLHLKLSIIKNAVQQVLQSQVTISATLYRELKEILLECEVFSDYKYLTDLVDLSGISAWRNGLPQMDTLALQVEATINYLLELKNQNGQNGLVLFLQVLAKGEMYYTLSYDQYPKFILTPQQTKLIHIAKKIDIALKQNQPKSIDTSELYALRLAYKLNYIAKVKGFLGFPQEMTEELKYNLGDIFIFTYRYNTKGDIAPYNFWPWYAELPKGGRSTYLSILSKIDYLLTNYQRNTSANSLVLFLKMLLFYYDKLSTWQGIPLKSEAKIALAELTKTIEVFFINKQLQIWDEYESLKKQTTFKFEDYCKEVEQKVKMQSVISLPAKLEHQLKLGFLELDGAFDGISSKLVRIFFNDTKLIYWQDKIPQRSDSSQQILALINYMLTQRQENTLKNGLLLFIDVLIGNLRGHIVQREVAPLLQAIRDFLETGNYSEDAEKIIKSQFYEGITNGLPQKLLSGLRTNALQHDIVFSDLNYFDDILNDIQVYGLLFSVNRPSDRFDIIIDYLSNKYDSNNKNLLVLFIEISQDYRGNSDLYSYFNQLATELESILVWRSPDLYPPQKLHQVRIRLEHDYKAQLNWQGNIPPRIYTELYNVFRKCDEFQDFRRLRSLFIDSRLIAWRSKLPEAEYMEEQIEWTIEFLFRGQDFTGYDGLRILRRLLLGENGLVLLLTILSERYEEMKPELHASLSELAKEVASLIPDTHLSEADIPTLEELLGA